MINQKLQNFEEEVKPIGDIMTQATIELYQGVVSKFLPTPTKIHYLFNLRDISKVGIWSLKSATAWQKNKQNGMCIQRRLRPARVSTQSDQSLAWRNIGSLATHREPSEDSDQSGRDA